MTDMYTWITVYKEIALKLREYRDRQHELLNFIAELKSQNFPTISLDDRDENGASIPLSEIDPFTFFASFNRDIRQEARTEIIRKIISWWQIPCSIPTDLLGIPTVSTLRSWFFAYKKERGPNDITLLWDLFEQALDRSISSQTFNETLKIKYVSFNITIGLFWIAPDTYLNLDKLNRDYLEEHGIRIHTLANYDSYVEYMEQTKQIFNKNFYEISHDAWLKHQSVTPQSTNIDESNPERKYWLYAPGEHGKYWNEFYSAGIMAVGCDALGDFREYSTKPAIVAKLREVTNTPESSPTNDANMCFSFLHLMKPGDVIYAKTGRRKILGRGIVTSDYIYDTSRANYKHVRQVAWEKKGEWTVSEENKFAPKTLTDATSYNNFFSYVESLINSDSNETPTVATTQFDESRSYWWLNANPSIWDISAMQIGEKETYSATNEAGNKRQKYEYFKQVKPGDMIIGYATSPVQQIVCICSVTQELHTSEEGEVFEFEKIKQLAQPISLKQLKSIPELAQSEPLKQPQGSLFHLTAQEFGIVRSLIYTQNELPDIQVISTKYSLEQFSEDTGFDTEKIDKWKNAIEYKKQAIIYGPPGTGKTYIADKLARLLVSETNGFYELIQFHPAYSYEEFITGIRPDVEEKGALRYKLEPGRFLKFCDKARKLKERTCVLIIDEINRANLAKVFGELMYLLEYRDKEIELPSGGKLSIPENVRIIGTMNTADRSIALVDYALRRRFAFIELAPDYQVLLNYHKKRGFEAERLVAILQKLNERINDKNYLLGITFFLKDDLRANIEQIWTMEIEPYLEEYFYLKPNVTKEFRWTTVEGELLP